MIQINFEIKQAKRTLNSFLKNKNVFSSKKYTLMDLCVYVFENNEILHFNTN